MILHSQLPGLWSFETIQYKNKQTNNNNNKQTNKQKQNRVKLKQHITLQLLLKIMLYYKSFKVLLMLIHVNLYKPKDYLWIFMDGW